MNITPEERDKAIDAILSQGLARPVPTWKFLRDMRRNLGLRTIFANAFSAVLTSVLAAALYFVLIYSRFISFQPYFPYTWLFISSPALFMCMTLMTEAIERLEGLYELKMTCRYTVRQITVFRLLCFSLAGAVFTLPAGYAFYSVAEIGYPLQLLSLALCSLFLCSWMIVHVMRRWKVGWWLGGLLWAVLGTIPLIIFGDAWENLLAHLSPAFTLGVAAICFVLFLREIKITIKISGEVYRYADS